MSTLKVHPLVAQPMDAESFAPFGSWAHEPDRQPDWVASGSRVDGVRESHEDRGDTPVAQLWRLGDLSFDAVPYIGFVRYFHQGFRVAEVERHPHETQTWLARSGTSFLVVAPATDSDAVPAPDDARAFVVEPGDLLAIGRGVWMCHFFPLGADATYTVLTARREPEQDRDLVNFVETAGTVLEIGLT